MDKPDINQEDVLDKEVQAELSPEEYEKQRAEGMKHLGKEIEYLEVEEKYQKLLADIEQHKTRRITMIGQRIQYYNQQQGPQLDEHGNPIQPVDEATPPSDNKPPKRKLKTD